MRYRRFDRPEDLDSGKWVSDIIADILILVAVVALMVK